MTTATYKARVLRASSPVTMARASRAVQLPKEKRWTKVLWGKNHNEERKENTHPHLNPASNPIQLTP